MIIGDSKQWESNSAAESCFYKATSPTKQKGNKMTDHTKRSWDSLSSVVAAIKKEDIEKVISFDGFEIETNKATYGLNGGELRRTEK